MAVSLSLVIALSAAPAFALLEDEAKSTSSTNPGIGAGFTWRWSWGKSLEPDMQISQVPFDGTAEERKETLGVIYEFHQVKVDGSGFEIPEWGRATTFVSPKPDGTLLDYKFDVMSLLGREGWWQGPGSVKTGEGMYGISFRFYNQFRTEEETATDFRIRGVDLTAPRQVDDLNGSVGSLPSANGWTEASWRDLRWTRKAYDDLSGVGGYRILLNGKEVAFEQNAAPDPTLGFEPYAHLLNPLGTEVPQLSQATIEDVPAGANKISIITVDRATNESAARTINAYIDPDTPKISITRPSSSAVVAAKPTFLVSAADKGGVSKVEYYIDGKLIGTSTKSPYSLSADLSTFSNGSHTLMVKVYDRIGSAAGSWRVPHVASASRSFRIDKVAPLLKLSSAGPSPFYPRKRDGYRDNFAVKFSSSESAKATLVITDSKGKKWRTITKSVPKGTSKIKWDGKSTSGKMKEGIFKWKLTLADAAGNKSASKSGKTSLRYYQVIKTSSSTVKIVAR